MLKILSGDKSYSVAFDNRERTSGSLNEQSFTWDVLEVKAGSFHIIRNNKSYNVEVLNANMTEKTFTIKVNGNTYDMQAKDRFDELLEQMGMSNLGSGKVSELKAPMPGLVLDIISEPGSAIKKGDPLIVLEAMKMENIIKSPTDGTVKKVNVAKGAAVEKNEVLIHFD